MVDCIVVLVTVESAHDGERIAQALVDERLAACVNIVGPMRSIYRWQGTVQHETELLMIIKTRAALFDALQRRVTTLHPYATPEVIALPLAAGSARYLDWVRGETESPS